MDPDQEFEKNSKFRSFRDEVGAVLSSFDKAKEWADLIKCMQKLQKVFTRYSQFPLIPLKLTFSKRMAQCLNPALPSGVHLKALQIFKHVFERIGPERLAKDLSIYSIGIFPLFQFAAINIKPVILEILQRFFMPLGSHLTPCLSGFIMAILPGLEEESSEFYDKCLKLLHMTSQKVGRQVFYCAMWKAVLMGPSVRGCAVTYLNLKLPRPDDRDPDNLTEHFPHKDTLVHNALLTGLTDSNILTQRTSMELVLNHFPLSSGMFDDWVDICVAVLQLLTRKEVSLNRRLYAWFLGTSPEYFDAYGKTVIVAGIQRLLEQAPVTLTLASRPFKIVISLLDKPEIGESIIESVLVYIFYAIQESKDGKYPFSRELIASANKLLDMLQPEIIWSGASKLYTTQLQQNLPEAIYVVDTLVDLVRRDLETTTVHLPKLLCAVIEGLEVMAVKKDLKSVLAILSLARKVFGKFSVEGKVHMDETASTPDREEVNWEGMYKAIALYQQEFGRLCNEHIFALLDSADVTEEQHGLAVTIVADAILLLGSLLIHLPTRADEPAPKPDNLPSWLEVLRVCCHMEDVRISTTGVQVFVKLLTKPNSGLNATAQRYVMEKTTYCEEAVQILWKILHHSHSAHHYCAAETLECLLRVAPDRVTDTISTFLLASDPVARVEACRRFGILWRLTTDMSQHNLLAKNAFLMLDTLTDEQPMVRLAGRSWLTDSVQKLDRLLDPLLEVLLSNSIVRERFVYKEAYDARRVLYIFGRLQEIIECDIGLFVRYATEKQVTKNILALNKAQAIQVWQAEDFTPVVEVYNYLDLLVATTIRFVRGQGDSVEEQEFKNANSVVQSTASAFLLFLLSNMTDARATAEVSFRIQEHVLCTLAGAVDKRDLVLQVQLLRLLANVIVLGSTDSDIVQVPGASEVRRSSAATTRASTGPTPGGSSGRPSICESPYFLPTITVGLNQDASNNVRSYWLEFLGTTLTYFRSDWPHVIPTVTRCLCDILAGVKNPHDGEACRDVIGIIQSLGIIARHCLVRDEAEIAAAQNKDTRSGGPHVIDMPLSILSGFIRVFGPGEESRQQVSPVVEVRNLFFADLPYLLRALVNVWGLPGRKTDEAQLLNKYEIQEQITRLLNPMTHEFANEFLYATCLLWEKHRHASQESQDIPLVIMDMINSLDSVNPGNLLRSMAFIINSVLKAKMNPNTKQAAPMHETTVLDFTNRYVSKTMKHGPELTRAWGDLVVLLEQAKLSRSPTAFLLLLRIMNNFVTRSVPMDDKRQRRELQDQCSTLVDQCIRIATDSTADAPKEGEAHSNMMSRLRNLSLKALNMTASIVPSMYAKVFEDKERAASNIVHTITSNIRDRSEGNLPWADASVGFLWSLMKSDYQPKLWKKDVMDTFHDSHFFLMDFESIALWRKIIDRTMQLDKAAFPELLRITGKSLQTSKATMMFVSKEQENILRARNIKRIAFVLLAGEMDQYSLYVPHIQEKLIEALKLSQASSVYEQVFLCMRVLLIRMSGKRLTTFWPTIVTELLRFFGYGHRNPAEPNLLLAACKFLDQAMITPAEQFHLYEWMFVLDGLNWPENKKLYFTPHVEQLARNAVHESPFKLNGPSKSSRQPMILLRCATNAEQLYNFLQHFSTMAYTNCVASKPASLAVIERVIEADMIEYANVNGFKGTPERLIQDTMQEEARKVVSMASASQVVSSEASRDSASALEPEDQLDVEDDDLEIETDIPKTPLVVDDDVAEAGVAAAAEHEVDDLDLEIESIKAREQAAAAGI
mmetsp:Transcript_12924/g.51598  ORF Transcript_12924/g.51598 Transcript_12924/m.51598 type:complete len:1773 (-) Transcript_12924:44-5362(-)|eukprot:CAMPEP_0114606698 /NCGR_PEP_ID=MMETSP0168-20121206/1697_1 /TAXON_ID=95228 ORGANISM="Vannella sp., Strain DIVA3 517/6/12" /NCGR_SAMPLE_ID=MMETSP0168 /ASSEMBLY_ACC=CAM_ASM_000044 /LENGTH=1772 /DNA_ID=CAMNT_0001817573 /DNA_START=60 /DNA_END=5378 /DNA_ORIENTATION=-